MADLRERRPAALLATFFVVVAGGLICLFIAATFAADFRGPSALLGGGLLMLSLFVWQLRERSEARLVRNELFWLIPRRDTRTKTVVRLARKSAPPTEYGTNQPPTAEQVRELAESGTCWVPARSVSRRRPRP